MHVPQGNRAASRLLRFVLESMCLCLSLFPILHVGADVSFQALRLKLRQAKASACIVTQISTRLIPTETLLKKVLHANVCIIAFPCIDQSHVTPPRSAGTSEAISKRVTRWKENRAAGQLQVSHESLLTLSAIACDAICHRNGTK
jgi:BarA-like signal transduction histidine kinase